MKIRRKCQSREDNYRPDFDSFSLFLTLLISETLDKSILDFRVFSFFPYFVVFLCLSRLCLIGYVLYPRKNKKVNGLYGKVHFIGNLTERRPSTRRRIPKSEVLHKELNQILEGIFDDLDEGKLEDRESWLSRL